MYNEVKDYLCSGSVESTETLSERDLAQKFNVKRGKIREVLIQIEGEGILKRMPLKGYQLNDFSGETPDEIKALRKTIELLAARRAARHADREDLVRLTLAYEELSKACAEGSEADRIESDRYFHTTIIKASKSRLLSHMFAFIQLPLFPPDNTPRSKEMIRNEITAHGLILEAIKNGDADRVGQLMEEHFSEDTVWYD